MGSAYDNDPRVVLVKSDDLPTLLAGISGADRKVS